MFLCPDWRRINAWSFPNNYFGSLVNLNFEKFIFFKIKWIEMKMTGIQFVKACEIRSNQDKTNRISKKKIVFGIVVVISRQKSTANS